MFKQNKIPHPDGQLYDGDSTRISSYLNEGRMRVFSNAKPVSNEEVIANQRYNHSSRRYHNLYEEQQLQRGIRSEKKTFQSRFYMSIALAGVCFVFAWMLTGAFQQFFAYGEYTRTMESAIYVSEDPDLSGIYPYVKKIEYRSGADDVIEYSPRTKEGFPIGDVYYSNILDVPIPQWYAEELISQGKEVVAGPLPFPMKPSLVSYLTFGGGISAVLVRLLCASGFGIVSYIFAYALLRRNLIVQNQLSDTSDVNQHYGDQHIAMPSEIFERFEPFPDAGAHSDVSFSTMISHAALSTKGLGTFDVALRAEEEILDDDGEVMYQKGELFEDENGDPIYETLPMIDTSFSETLFDSVDIPKIFRRYFNASKIPYNPTGRKRERLDSSATFAERIKNDWTLPHYETQRPGGAYLVDTAPANTMLVAITRAGKGQRYIEPVLDMKTRENIKSNLIVNDPKGELALKNYVKATVRGYQPIQFNLINPIKTDIYQPLLLAANSAREGDIQKCSNYVKNIAEVFFPNTKGDDQMWNNAASNAFQRAAYGLIDYYLEKEKSLRRQAVKEKWSSSDLETRIDQNWGKVTLYNCYIFFTELAGEVLPNPWFQFQADDANGVYEELKRMNPEEFRKQQQRAQRQAVLWGNKESLDKLTLYFNAVNRLPRNRLRQMVFDSDNSLRMMGNAEKMLASVYGIASTAMSFFTDPTISMLTSGTPRQSIDLSGISFPRKVGIRFDPVFMKKNKWIGKDVYWSAYEDPIFTKPLGEKFSHEAVVTKDGWADYFFEGIFPNDKAYLKLDIKDPENELPLKTFYFEFKKSYATSLSGRRYLKDPVLNEKIINGGTIDEIICYYSPEKKKYIFKKGRALFRTNKILNITSTYPTVSEVQMPIIVQDLVRYSEKPKMIFLVTPPHLAKYTKLVLIFLNQIINLNFDQSYLTKEDQKPLLKTFVMLDEAGNLQSEGHGIENFSTMLSIGLGQDQYFTVVLQTLQQLRDVYGDSSDKIIQGNTANIIFYKSTDDDMLSNLEKMSGKTHKTYVDSKQVSVDHSRIWLKNQNTVSYTANTVEEPVISYTDLNSLTLSDSIVFRAGESPVWNRNEMAVPMSYALFANDIQLPGKKFSLNKLPSLSTAKDFDVNQNIPDFNKILDEIMEKALLVDESVNILKSGYGYSDTDLQRMDKDYYADEVMELIDALGQTAAALDDREELKKYIDQQTAINQEMKKAIQQSEAVLQEHEIKRFASGKLSRSDLIGMGGAVNHSLDHIFSQAYADCINNFKRDHRFLFSNDSLFLNDGNSKTLLIRKKDMKQMADQLNQAANDPNSAVYANQKLNGSEKAINYEITDDFYKYLSGLDSWSDLANGKFERDVVHYLQIENSSGSSSSQSTPF